MFERFTQEAREAVVAAQREAGTLRHGWIGTEHLLLGVLSSGGGGAELLGAFGVDAPAIRGDVLRIVGPGDDDLDPEALAILGIDLDAVRARVEDAFGPGALSRREPCRRGTTSPYLPFTPRAKKALELTLREATHLRSRELRSEHLVLGLLHAEDGLAARMLTARGVTLAASRARIAGRDAA
jgi:ATP-dependent Clp protease ATP-binding subunit ClpA